MADGDALTPSGSVRGGCKHEYLPAEANFEPLLSPPPSDGLTAQATKDATEVWSLTADSYDHIYASSVHLGRSWPVRHVCGGGRMPDRGPGGSEAALLEHQELIREWLQPDGNERRGLRLTKVHQKLAQPDRSDHVASLNAADPRQCRNNSPRE